MAEKPTPLDDLIESKLDALSLAADESRTAAQRARQVERVAQELEREMQQLVIARSVLRDGKACGHGDANVEIHRLVSERSGS